MVSDETRTKLPQLKTDRPGRSPNNPGDYRRELPDVARLAGWRSPQAANGPQGAKSLRDFRECSITSRCAVTLTDQAAHVLAGWGTPRAMERCQWNNHDNHLSVSAAARLVLAGWPTADAYPRGGATCPMKRRAGGHSVSLQDMASGVLSVSFLSGTGKRGALRPGHSRWLMGYRGEWDCCGAMAMQLCRRTGRSSSGRGRKARGEGEVNGVDGVDEVNAVKGKKRSDQDEGICEG